jgi:hypothetical protein
VGQRNVDELARRVCEGTDPHPRRLQAAQLGVRVGTRPEVDRRPVVREPLEQRPPVAELLVEDARRGRPVIGHPQVDVRPAGRVGEPVVPERPRVGEHRVEIEGDWRHRRMLDSRSNRRAVRELRCKSGTVPPL